MRGPASQLLYRTASSGVRRVDDFFSSARGNFAVDASLEGLQPDEEALLGPVGARTRFQRGTRLFFGGTSYLGLPKSRIVRVASAVATLRYGTSVSASRSTTGTHQIHLLLERALATYMGTEDAVVCGAGAVANRILLQALKQENDVIFAEEGSHPSLYGAVLGAKTVRSFRVDDLDTFKVQLSLHLSGIIILNGVDAVSGKVAPLDRIFAALPEGKDYRVVVDDCHGVFILGKNGRGTPELFDLSQTVYQTATMSKALGSFGGFIAGSSEFCDQLRATTAYRSATALPPSVAAASLMSLLLLMRDGGKHRNRAISNTEYAAAKLRELGFSTTFHGVPILSLKPPVGIDAKRISLELKNRFGIIVPFMHYPSTDSPGQLRLALSSDHNRKDIDELCLALKRILDK